MMIVSGLAACDKPGPAETVGKKIDQTSENVSAAVSGAADSAGTAITKQSKEAGQAISDSEITTLVKSALLGEPGLQSLKVTVVTNKGEVVLTGTANSKANSNKAESLAKSVNGVKSVKNKLTITG